jgi:hypothetical protein
VLKLNKREVSMATVLYKLVDGDVESEMVEAIDVDRLLKSGYCTCPDSLAKIKKADTNNSGKLSSEEIKEAAKEAGITIGRKSIKTLRKELGYE